jgi:SAM-dependent methyltransferase
MRAEQRDRWNEVASGWSAFDPALDPLTEHLLDSAAVRTGSRVLDLACGAGDAALRAAERVGPTGYVLGLDLSPGMIELAQAEARRRSLAQVEFRAVDSELDLRVTAGSFDCAVCKHGLMWMPDPPAAMRSLFDALRPGGRVSVSSWASLDDHPLVGGLRREAERRLGAELPPEPGPPNPLTDRASLALPLSAAGFTDIRVDTIPIIWDEADTPEALVRNAIDDDDALRHAVATADPSHRHEFESAAVAALVASQPGPPWTLSINMLVACGIRP